MTTRRTPTAKPTRSCRAQARAATARPATTDPQARPANNTGMPITSCDGLTR